MNIKIQIGSRSIFIGWYANIREQIFLEMVWSSSVMEGHNVSILLDVTTHTEMHINQINMTSWSPFWPIPNRFNGKITGFWISYFYIVLPIFFKYRNTPRGSLSLQTSTWKYKNCELFSYLIDNHILSLINFIFIYPNFSGMVHFQQSNIFPAEPMFQAYANPVNIAEIVRGFTFFSPVP